MYQYIIKSKLWLTLPLILVLSLFFSLEVSSAYDPPTIPTPADKAINVLLTPTLSWNAVPFANSYKVQISTTPYFNVNDIVWNSSYISTNSYTLPLGYLNYNSKYYWRVSSYGPEKNKLPAPFKIVLPKRGSIFKIDAGSSEHVKIVVCSQEKFDFVNLKTKPEFLKDNLSWVGMSDIDRNNDIDCGKNYSRKWIWSLSDISEKIDAYIDEKHDGKYTFIANNNKSGDNYRETDTFIYFDVFTCGDNLEYEGESYGTLLLNGNCWFKKNLNIGTQIPRIARASRHTTQDQDPNNNIIEKYCYNNDSSKCDVYGGLYQWEEAMQMSIKDYHDKGYDSHIISGNTFQGICPSGWHIPTYKDFLSLWGEGADYEWLAKDGASDTKFNGLLSGGANIWSNNNRYNKSIGSVFAGENKSEFWWTSYGANVSDNFFAELFYIDKDTRTARFGYDHEKRLNDINNIYQASSVRCVKDKAYIAPVLNLENININETGSKQFYDPTKNEVRVKMKLTSNQSLISPEFNIDIFDNADNRLPGTITLNTDKYTNRLFDQNKVFEFNWDITGIPDGEYIVRARYADRYYVKNFWYTNTIIVVVKREDKSEELGCKNVGKVVQWYGGQRLASGARAKDLNAKKLGIRANYEQYADFNTYYGIKEMPDGRCWMTENLNLINSQEEFFGLHRKCNNSSVYYCYEYGSLSSWEDAMKKYDISDNTAYYYDKEQGLCPNNWHIPSSEEYDALFNSIDYGQGPKEFLIGGSTGFNALLAGNKTTKSQYNLYDIGSHTNWWTSTQYKKDFSLFTNKSLVNTSDTSINTSYNKSDVLYNLRCIFDIPASLTITYPEEDQTIYIVHDMENKVDTKENKVDTKAEGLARNELVFDEVLYNLKKKNKDKKNEDYANDINYLHNNKDINKWDGIIDNAVEGDYMIQAYGFTNKNKKEITDSQKVNFKIRYYPYCGDGKKDNPNHNGVNEECDGDDFGGIDLACKAYLGKNYIGEIKCNKDCLIDTSGCKPATIEIRNPIIYPYNHFNPDEDEVVQFEVWSNLDEPVYIRNDKNDVLNTYTNKDNKIIKEIIIKPVEERKGNKKDGWLSIINWTINKRIGEYGFVPTGIYNSMGIFANEVNKKVEDLDVKSNIAPITIIRDVNIVLTSENGLENPKSHYKFDISKPNELIANLNVSKNVKFDEDITLFIKRKNKINNDKAISSPERGDVTNTYSKFNWNLDRVDPDIWVVVANTKYQGDPVYSNEIEIEMYYPKPKFTITYPNDKDKFYLPQGKTMIDLIDVLGESTKNYFKKPVILYQWFNNSIARVESVFANAGINKYKYPYKNLVPGIYSVQGSGIDKKYGEILTNKVTFEVMKPKCGNSIVEADEECDEGDNNNDHGKCNTKCRWTKCTDHIKQTPNGKGTKGPKDDGNEDCDGKDFGEKNKCKDWLDSDKEYIGNIKCKLNSCVVDTSDCKEIKPAKCGSMSQQRYDSEPTWPTLATRPNHDNVPNGLCEVGDAVKPVYIPASLSGGRHNPSRWTWTCTNIYDNTDIKTCFAIHGSSDNCKIYLNGGLFGRPSIPSVIYDVPLKSNAINNNNIFGVGDYAYNYSTFPQVNAGTLDGIAIEEGTRLEMWNKTNFSGDKIIDIIGPAVINNYEVVRKVTLRDISLYNLSDCYGLGQSRWKNCYNMHTVYSTYHNMRRLGINGSMKVSCTDQDPPDIAINGQCGKANNKETKKKPSSNAELCKYTSSTIKSKQSIKGNNPWSWKCYGLNGGSDVDCQTIKQKDPIIGECGEANQKNRSSKPNTMADLCKKTSKSLLETIAGITGNNPWYWKCYGQYGGKDVICNTISSECGNGKIESGEECDNGLRNSDSGECNTKCKLTYCGDDIVQNPNGKHENGKQKLLIYGYEDCDGKDFNGKNECNDWFNDNKVYTGYISCYNTCLIDLSDCKEVLNPVCGTEYNNKTYNSEPTWNSNLLCNIGTPNPNPPAFNNETNVWEWSCVDDSRSVECKAYYENETEGEPLIDCSAPEHEGGPRNNNGYIVANRNGGHYGTVLIGEQCWFADNLNAGIIVDAPNNQNNTTDIRRYCYNNNPDNCFNKGGLYEYANYRYRWSICPNDWRVPTNKDYLHAEFEMRDNQELFNRFNISTQYAGWKLDSNSNFKDLNNRALLMTTGCYGGLCSGQCYNNACDVVTHSIVGNTAQSIRCVQDIDLPDWNGVCGTSAGSSTEPNNNFEYCKYTGLLAKSMNSKSYDGTNWTWVCYGDNKDNDDDNLINGDDVECSTAINQNKRGLCGPIDGTSMIDLPEQTASNFSKYCSYSKMGYPTTYDSITGKNNESDIKWTWKCYGDNYGTNNTTDYVECSANKLRLLLSAEQTYFNLRLPNQSGKFTAESTFDMKGGLSLQGYYYEDLDDTTGEYEGTVTSAYSAEPYRKFVFEDFPIITRTSTTRKEGYIRMNASINYYPKLDQGDYSEFIEVKSNEVVLELRYENDKKDGKCGDTKLFITKPNPDNDSLCTEGAVDNINGHVDSFRIWTYPDRLVPWKWDCLGQDGGSNSNCTAIAPYLKISSESKLSSSGLGKYISNSKAKDKMLNSSSPWSGIESFIVSDNNSQTTDIHAFTNVPESGVNNVDKMGIWEVDRYNKNKIGFIGYFEYKGIINNEYEWSINNWDYKYSNKEPNNNIKGKRLSSGNHYFLAYAFTNRENQEAIGDNKTIEVISNLQTINIPEESGPRCGNGIAEGDEECDKNDFRNKNCTDFYGECYEGNPTCLANCKVNKGSCTTTMLPPKLIYPANNATNQPSRIDFQWKKPEFKSGCFVPDGYYIQVATANDFADNNIHDDEYVNSTANTITQRMYNFKTNTDYYWRVRGKKTKADGTKFGKWSEIWKFTGEELLPPKLISPKDKSVVKSKDDLEFVWTRVDSADGGYRGLVATDPNNWDGSNVDSFTATQNTTKKVPSLNLFNTNVKYYWHMQSINGLNRSDYSDTWEFTISECGDDYKHPEEACDKVAGKYDFGGLTCMDFESNGTPFTGGELTCRECKIDTTRCTVCGNGRIEAPYEDCEINPYNLNGQTCASLGYGQQGDLECSDTCKFDGRNCIDNCDFGDGTDGDVVINSNVNINTDIISNGRICADGASYSVDDLTNNNIAYLTEAPDRGCLESGDLVLLINLQGVEFNSNNTGNFEVLEIASMFYNTIQFTTNIQNNYGYNMGLGNGDQKVIIQRIPQYENLTINPGATLTASAWNGFVGGVLAFKVSDTFVNNGIINMSELGYRGGPNDTRQWSRQINGYQGEGISNGYMVIQDGNDYINTRQSNNLNSGAAGVGTYDWCAGGGAGGGHASKGENGCLGEGRQLPDGVPMPKELPCEYLNNGTGCYTYNGHNSGIPGYGGDEIGRKELSRMYFGGAGGAGGQDDYYSSITNGFGGNGGGIIYIFAKNTINNGLIMSDGQNGENCANAGEGGSGGGGAGGSILMTSCSINVGNISSNYGVKGVSPIYQGTNTSGHGGNGSLGRIAIRSNNIINNNTESPIAFTRNLGFNCSCER